MHNWVICLFLATRHILSIDIDVFYLPPIEVSLSEGGLEGPRRNSIKEKNRNRNIRPQMNKMSTSDAREE